LDQLRELNDRLFAVETKLALVKFTRGLQGVFDNRHIEQTVLSNDNPAVRVLPINAGRAHLVWLLEEWWRITVIALAFLLLPKDGCFLVFVLRLGSLHAQRRQLSYLDFTWVNFV
jgi:hypothetical protein